MPRQGLKRVFLAWAECSVSRAERRPEIGVRMIQEADGATGAQMPNVKKSRGFALITRNGYSITLESDRVTTGFVGVEVNLTNTLSSCCHERAIFWMQICIFYSEKKC